MGGLIWGLRGSLWDGVSHFGSGGGGVPILRKVPFWGWGGSHWDGKSHFRNGGGPILGVSRLDRRPHFGVCGGVPFWGWGFSFRVGSVWMGGVPF